MTFANWKKENNITLGKRFETQPESDQRVGPHGVVDEKLKQIKFSLQRSKT